MKESMDFEKLLKAWAKAKSQDEESIFFFSARPKEDEYFFFIWTKPKEAETEEEEEEEGSEAPLPDMPNFKSLLDLNQTQRATPLNHFEEEGDIYEFPVQKGSLLEEKMRVWQGQKPKGPEYPRSTREIKDGSISPRDYFRFGDNPIYEDDAG